MTEERLILQKLERIEKGIEDIKERMVDVDSVLTEEDFVALVEYRKEKSSQSLTSHEQLKKELGF